MSLKKEKTPVDVLIVAVKETAGSALYGMVDVLSAAGNVWQSLTRSGGEKALFRIRIVSLDSVSFTCGNGIPVTPACSITANPVADIVILPELWLGPDEDIKGRYPELMDWIRQCHRQGMMLYSACSGAIMLAESGLLDGCRATSHWGYQDLFRRHYPRVLFQPEPNLLAADPAGQIITAGGTTSWHDLALHIIARHAGVGEAMRIAKVYLLKWHDEGQLPYAQLTRNIPHADALVRRCEQVMREHFRDPEILRCVIESAAVPERTLKRRFKMATGMSLLEYAQSLRIEEAKRQLEESDSTVEEVCLAAGYEDFSFFRRLFKRLTGLSPAQYRKMFTPLPEKITPKID